MFTELLNRFSVFNCLCYVLDPCLIIVLLFNIRFRFWTPGPRSRPGPQTKYLTYGFAYIQDVIEQAIIMYQTGLQHNIGIVIQQFPYPCYIEDS
jgi:hypothetical protein